VSFSWVLISLLLRRSNSYQTSTVVDGFEDYRTLWPSAIYDIRAVFDGSIINPGFNGYPTIFYTSVTFGPLGAVANETEGVETQSMGKYTT
jgi:beta-fructofuranosidase